jgi:hypothetical protein
LVVCSATASYDIGEERSIGVMPPSLQPAMHGSGRDLPGEERSIEPGRGIVAQRTAAAGPDGLTYIRRAQADVSAVRANVPATGSPEHAEAPPPLSAPSPPRHPPTRPARPLFTFGAPAVRLPPERGPNGVGGGGEGPAAPHAHPRAAAGVRACVHGCMRRCCYLCGCSYGCVRACVNLCGCVYARLRECVRVTARDFLAIISMKQSLITDMFIADMAIAGAVGACMVLAWSALTRRPGRRRWACSWGWGGGAAGAAGGDAGELRGLPGPDQRGAVQGVVSAVTPCRLQCMAVDCMYLYRTN